MNLSTIIYKKTMNFLYEKKEIPTKYHLSSNRIPWCLKRNSINNAPLNGNEPSIYHLSNNLKQIAE